MMKNAPNQELLDEIEVLREHVLQLEGYLQVGTRKRTATRMDQMREQRRLVHEALATSDAAPPLDA